MEVGRERGAWTVERLITAILSTRDWAFMRTISEMYGVGSVAHLPKTILSMYVPFGKEEVMLAAGKDVGDASLVSVDIDRSVQPGDVQVTVGLGKRIVHGEVDEGRDANDKYGNDAK